MARKQTSLLLCLTAFLFIFTACRQSSGLSSYVDLFQGTSGYGHCHPCASWPFGMVSVGPQTGNCAWEYTGGYQYPDTTLQGFSHNRLNGVGSSDLGDLLILPFAEGSITDSWTSHFDKKSEKAEPGWYSIYMDEAGVLASMVATEHCALESFLFDQPDKARMLVDLQSGIVSRPERLPVKVRQSTHDTSNPYRLTGKTLTKGWVNRTYYYCMEFSAPYTVESVLPKRDSLENGPRMVLAFDLKGKELKVKVSISRESVEGAIANLAAEVPGWDLAKHRKEVKTEWESLFSRILIEGTDVQKEMFYSAMYKLFIHPDNVADAGKKPHYSTFSLWDTYRAAHPLYTLIAPDKVDDFVNSMLDQYDEQGFLPIWSLWGIENYGMIGDHAVPVIVDAYLKGFKGFDAERAYEAVKTSLTTPEPKTNWTLYDKYGYFPFDLVKEESVSRTLECCYDDYCAYLFAKALGKEEDAAFFLKRAGYYRNLFDPGTKLMRGKDTKGQWRTPFNHFMASHASTAGGDYTEGNAWQYTWHVQHDVPGLIGLIGGEEAFCTKLDTLFSISRDISNGGFSDDVTGLIGQYAHGNEPSHHVAYLYALAGRPERTQELIRTICETQYNPGPEGLCGNDDCGQMSAWYIFSMLGFYPVNPCGGDYVIGAPQLPSATIFLPEGKTLKVVAQNLSEGNKYVKEVILNGKTVEGPVLRHADLVKGGELRFMMTAEPTGTRP